MAIDDFAFRKGSNYGTLICDLNTHQPIDVLPNRTKTSVTDWLTMHSEVVLVTRDGSNIYRAGIDAVNRPMVQIMDRFHLIQILYRWMLASLQHILPHQWSYILNFSNPPNQPETESKAEEIQEIKIDMKPNQQKKWELIQVIKKQHQTGQSIRSLAKANHLSRNTVKKYIELKEPPTIKRKRRSTLLNGYINLIIIGIENNLSSHRIFEQIKQQGYKGSYSMVRAKFTEIRKLKKKDINKIKEQRVIIQQKKAISLYWKLNETLTENERRDLNYSLKKFPKTNELYAFVQTFRDHFNQLNSVGIQQLLSVGKDSLNPEIKRFSQFLYKDLQPILASIYYTYSNGVIEGQINRLKTIKRTLYGRSSFELLRKRVLYHM
ncbi:ISL3 family transposase [Schinkia sp. CFF1]